MTIYKSIVLFGLLVVLAVVTFFWAGWYGMGADDPHFKTVYSLLETVRTRSIQRAARDIVVPNLSEQKMIQQGAGNYKAMCVTCHLAPDMQETELSKGLYPQPPNLTQRVGLNAAEKFWVIKHGIKTSGMPAWGKSMDDQFIWGMVAFIEKLPDLTSAQYQEMTRHNGHSHGGGESMRAADHHEDHGDGMPDMDHDMMEISSDHRAPPMDESKPHKHPPGSAH
jgi:mono/diheme cytochrome c family protein